MDGDADGVGPCEALSVAVVLGVFERLGVCDEDRDRDDEREREGVRVCDRERDCEGLGEGA